MEKQSHDHNSQHLPEIVVGGTDYVRLTNLANATFDTVPDTAEELCATHCQTLLGITPCATARTRCARRDR